MANQGHDWEFSVAHAVEGSSPVLAVAICKACGQVRHRALPVSDAQALDVAGECTKRPRPGRLVELTSRIPTVSPLIAVIAGILGLVGATYVMNPNLAPQTTRAIEITDIAVERDVSWQEYSSKMPVRRATLGAADPYCEGTEVSRSRVSRTSPCSFWRPSRADALSDARRAIGRLRTFA